MCIEGSGTSSTNLLRLMDDLCQQLSLYCIIVYMNILGFVSTLINDENDKIPAVFLYSSTFVVWLIVFHGAKCAHTLLPAA